MSLCPYGLKKSGYLTKILVKCRMLEVVETNLPSIMEEIS